MKVLLLSCSTGGGEIPVLNIGRAVDTAGLECGCHGAIQLLRGE